MADKPKQAAIPPRPTDPKLAAKFDKAMEALRQASDADRLKEELGRDQKTRDRRTYIIGGELMRRAVNDKRFAAVVEELKVGLVRPADRKAFGLPERENVA